MSIRNISVDIIVDIYHGENCILITIITNILHY